jgi:hypothetical protein
VIYFDRLLHLGDHVDIGINAVAVTFVPLHLDNSDEFSSDIPKSQTLIDD